MYLFFLRFKAAAWNRRCPIQQVHLEPILILILLVYQVVIFITISTFALQTPWLYDVDTSLIKDNAHWDICIIDLEEDVDPAIALPVQFGEKQVIPYFLPSIEQMSSHAIFQPRCHGH